MPFGLTDTDLSIALSGQADQPLTFDGAEENLLEILMGCKAAKVSMSLRDLLIVECNRSVDALEFVPS